jgi:UDP-N-acetylglucosamine--N-acetylmuramyl-(pentapeptide) pyrophosphoryl-undecaprenol N-acetylglucosamine transferase
MKPKRIIISGGGTGGHIFPALAIAGGLKDRLHDSDILFVGARGKMEMEKVPAAGFKIIGLPVMGFPRKPGFNMAKFFLMLLKSSREANRLIDNFKPDIAIGVGGFASGPILQAAARKGIPTLIQEQNSYAGITNKLLGKKANKICVAYENMERFFPAEKIIMTGNPVRKNILEKHPERIEATSFYNLNSQDKVVLIIGGSLGARSINNAVLKNLDLIGNSDIKVIWQTGAIYYEEMLHRTSENKPENLQIHKFLGQMDKAYGAADIIISRAGAGTISELCLIGKPVILVPSPNVAEDHQTKNALALVDKDAAILVRDNEMDETLFNTVLELLGDQTRLKQLSQNIKKLAKPDATLNIVNEVMAILK